MLDDIIVWWIEPTSVFDVMPNASNTERVRSRDRGATTSRRERAIIAVQGPEARRAAGDGRAGGRGRRPVPRRAASRGTGTGCTVAGTGYTGEDGVELAVPAEAAVGCGGRSSPRASTPAGLGARDTLRLEAALPLHGHELGPGITPLQAGLGWVVAWTKPTFRGRDALAAERERGVHRLLRGISTEGRRPPRAESRGAHRRAPRWGRSPAGTSRPSSATASRSPSCRPTVEEGAAVEIDVRGTALAGTVVPTPFVRKA